MMHLAYSVFLCCFIYALALNSAGLEWLLQAITYLEEAQPRKPHQTQK